MTKNTSGGGLGFAGALTLLFIALKLMGFIDWSWWWVWSPIWIGLLIPLLFGVFVVCVIVIKELVKQ